MAFPQVAAVNGGGNTTNTTSHTVNLPSGIVSGNLLLVFFASDGTPTITFPSGWTQLFQTAGGTDVKFGAWYRIADGTEGATITVTTSASECSNHTSYRITGYSGTPEVGTSATGNSTTPNPPSLTPSWGAKDTLWFACQGNDGSTATTAYPTNYTNGRNDNNSVSDPTASVATARRELNAASEDPGTFTIATARNWVANTVAVKPIAAIALSAVSAGVCSVSASLAVAHSLSAVSAGVASVSGALRVAHSLSAAIAGVATVTANLTNTKWLRAVIAGEAAVSGFLRVARALSAVSAGSSSVSGAIRVARALSATIACSSTVTASLFHVRKAVRTLAAVRNLLAVRNIPPVR